MKGIILAAGRGSRMGSLTSNMPKCRTKIFGKELIEWQLSAMQNSSIDDISIVTGYMSNTFDFQVKYFNNPKWQSSNMVTSLLAASSWLRSDTCIISYSDIVYMPSTIEKLKKSNSGISITYDLKWKDLWSMRFDDPLSDAETFKVKEGCVIEIGSRAKNIKDIEGQYMGLIKTTPDGWSSVENFLSKLSPEIIDKMDMTSLLQKMIGLGVKIDAVPISDPWMEVDTESDLAIYKENYEKHWP